MEVIIYRHSRSYSLHELLLERLLDEPMILGSEVSFTEIVPTIEYQAISNRTDQRGTDADGRIIIGLWNRRCARMELTILGVVLCDL